jgi:hypothetical protein
MKDYEIKLKNYFTYYTTVIRSGRDSSEVLRLKELWDIANEELKKSPPRRIWIGVFGIVWLLIGCIVYPVCLIPKENLDYTLFRIYTFYIKQTSFLKFLFLVGLILLLAYLVSEIIIYMKSKKTENDLNGNILSMIKASKNFLKVGIEKGDKEDKK